MDAKNGKESAADGAAREADKAAILAGLFAMGLEDARYVALYRKVAKAFGMGACEMWILYYLSAAENGLAQHALAARMFFPKQTVHSAVSRMVRRGDLSLSASPASRKEKLVCLTAAGRKRAATTSSRLLQAEIRATRRLGKKRMHELNRLRAAYFVLLEHEFEGDFLAHEP